MSSFISVIAIRVAGNKNNPNSAICNLAIRSKLLLLFNINVININIIKVSPIFKIVYTIPILKRFLNVFTAYSPISTLVFFIACIKAIKNTIIAYPIHILEIASEELLEYISFSNPIAIPSPITYPIPLCPNFFKYVSQAKKFIADKIAIVRVLFIIVPVSLLRPNIKNSVVNIIIMFVAAYCLKLFL